MLRRAPGALERWSAGTLQRVGAGPKPDLAGKRPAWLCHCRHIRHGEARGARCEARGARREAAVAAAVLMCWLLLPLPMGSATGPSGAGCWMRPANKRQMAMDLPTLARGRGSGNRARQGRPGEESICACASRAPPRALQLILDPTVWRAGWLAGPDGGTGPLEPNDLDLGPRPRPTPAAGRKASGRAGEL